MIEDSLSVRRQVAAGLLLVAATAVSFAAARQLADLGSLPPRPDLYYSAFALSLLGGFVAGRLAPPNASQPVPRPAVTPSPPGSFSRWMIHLLLAEAALVLSIWTWILQSRAMVPPIGLLVWLGSILCAVLAFPTPRGRVGPPTARAAGSKALLLILLILAGCARLIALDRVPAVFSGDEANQTMDGRSYVDGSNRSNPFGTGWYSSMRLGMLPAGAGAAWLGSPIAGPRLPYAVFGTLSVVAAAAAAGLLAGPWAAVGTAGLLALAPHHVHFSRLASIMILDAFFASAVLALLLAVRRAGSPRTAALAGVCAGLALYGYSGGRMIALTFLLVAPFVAWRSAAVPGRRWLIAAALLLGFAVAALPNLRFALEHFPDWSERFQESSIFAPWFWKSEVPRFGVARVLIRQFQLGTLGLLSMPGSVWFSEQPLIGPPLFTALGIVGIGWIFARRQLLGAVVLALFFAGNLAGIILTTGTPAPQRAASLVAVLAILGGVAVAGFLELFPERGPRAVPWRFALALLFVGGYVARGAAGYPLDPGPLADYGGLHSAFAQEASRFLLLPGFRGEKGFLHGRPHVDSRFPPFAYFLPEGRLSDADERTDEIANLAPGLHVYSPELVAIGRRGAEAIPGHRGLALGHPAYPLREIAYVVRVRRSSP